MNQLVIRVDASVWIGTGHVMRCLVLADELSSRGLKPKFACLPQNGDMISYIESRGYEVFSLTPCQAVTPKQNDDYLGWLQRTVEEDSSDFFNQVKSVDLVIVDHYALDASWHKRIKSRFNCKVVAIDDLARQHDADILIDQTLGRSATDYSGIEKILTGTRYALLNNNFSKLRSEAEKRVRSRGKLRVLISMGGIDLPNATSKIIHSLADLPDTELTVLLGERSPHYKRVKELSTFYDNVKHINFTSDMAGLMLAQDIAVGAPGSTSWERACLGLPSIVIPIADNQNMICEQLVKHGACLSIPLETIQEALPDALIQLTGKWREYYHNSLAICDGRGAVRVTDEIMRVINEDNNLMH